MSASAGVDRARRVAEPNGLDTSIETNTEPLGDRRPRRDHLHAWLWAATLTWIVGMATVFPIGNETLEAVSVFTYDRIAFLAVATLFGLMLVRHPDLLRRWGRVETLMGVYLVVVLVSWATTLPDKHLVDVKRDGALLLNSILMPYLAFVIGRHCVRTRAQMVTALAVLVVGIGIFLIGVGSIQGLIDWQFLVAAADQTIHQSRARGTFQNALPYSVVLALLVPVALLLTRLESRRVARVLLIVWCIGCVEALVLGQVRIVWVAVLAALLYLAAVRVWMQRSAVVFAGGMLAAIGLGIGGLDARLVARPDGTVRQPYGTVADRLADSESIYNRVAVYSTALNMIAHRPLVGFGFGAHTFEMSRAPYYASCCGVSPEWAVACAVPHNEVLNLLVLMGAAGLLVYVVLLRELWRQLAAGRASADPLRATLAACVLADFIMLIITAQLHDVMYLYVAQVLFFFLAGLAASPVLQPKPIASDPGGTGMP